MIMLNGTRNSQDLIRFMTDTLEKFEITDVLQVHGFVLDRAPPVNR